MNRPQRRLSPDDRTRGSATVEVLAVAFGVMAITVVALQIFAVMYAGQAAGRAAWDAARAQSLGQSAVSAAHASMPGSVSVESVSSVGDGIRVTVRPHQIMPGLDVGTISRTAYLP